ncbi:NAD(P)-dependent oxidoreductase [bacterium]|nr:NAD(P)-dependent oxidoreductase [bacterium]MDB4607454.1 NAD(P)-dependent oxidoreductase [bacterium]MDC0304528.1 NAD(P)-dependent oxidoreductase [Akkermansiaceae bacterium]
MKVLVSGLNGFLVTHLFSELEKKAGLDLTVLSHSYKGNYKGFRVLDYTSFIKENLERFDVAILAGSSIEDRPDNLFLTSFNCNQFHSLLLSLKRTGVGRVIHISSASLILKSLVQSSLYLQSKQIQETIVQNLNFDSSLILRLSSPIGVGMQENRIFYQMIKKLENKAEFEFYGDLNRMMNYVDVRDATENIVCALENKELVGTFFLSSPRSVTNIGLFKNLVGSLNLNIGYKHIKVYEEAGLDISCDHQRILFPNKRYKSPAETAKWMIDEDIRF